VNDEVKPPALGSQHNGNLIATALCAMPPEMECLREIHMVPERERFGWITCDVSAMNGHWHSVDTTAGANTTVHTRRMCQ
jgi:hypothetical protein